MNNKMNALIYHFIVARISICRRKKKKLLKNRILYTYDKNSNLKIENECKIIYMSDKLSEKLEFVI